MAAVTRSRAVLLLFLFFAARLTAAAILVPPWQNPDEPAHFSVIRALTYNAWLDIANRRNVQVHAELLRSMAEHDWWAAYGEPVPEPFPTTFIDVPTHLGDAATAPPLYYVAMAAYCRVIHARSLLAQYYGVRLVSVALTLLTFALILRGAREWFGERVAFYAGVLVALVPQFVIIGVSVSPDPFLFTASAFIWWQAARLARRKGVSAPVFLMVLAAAAAVLSKTLAIPLLVQVPALLLVAALFTRRGRVLAATAVAAAIVLRVTGTLRAATWLNDEQLLALHRRTLILGWGEFEASWSYLADFSWRLFESSYLVAGWQRFYPPPWLIWTALVVFSALLARGLWAGGVRGEWRPRLAVLGAVLFCAVQVAAIYGTKYYTPGYGAQGRFLFPAIGPFAALCALGLTQWRSQLTGTRVCLAIVALLGLLDLVGWMTAVVPVYARWI